MPENVGCTMLYEAVRSYDFVHRILGVCTKMELVHFQGLRLGGYSEPNKLIIDADDVLPLKRLTQLGQSGAGVCCFPVEHAEAVKLGLPLSFGHAFEADRQSVARW